MIAEGTTIWRLKFDKVVSDVYFSPKKRPKRAVILAYGLFSSPPRKDSEAVRKLVSNGFMVWCPHYIGTFASDGLCTFENCASTIYQTAKMINGGKGVEIWDNTKVRWKISDTILIGSSLGGAASLVAGAKSKHVNKIVSLAGPTDIRKRRNLQSYIPIWKRGFANVWRSTQAHWERFVKGYLDLNAVDYADKLKEKSIFLIHDKKDGVVRVSHSTELYKRLKTGSGKHKILLTNRGDHMGFSSLADSKIFPQVLRWIK